MHGGSGSEFERVAYREVCREFGLTPASGETAWLIAADRAQELGFQLLADLMRTDPTSIIDRLVEIGSGSGSGDGSGDGYGSGDGSGYGDGSGDGKG